MTDAIDLLFTEVRTVAALGVAAAAGLHISWIMAPVLGILVFSIAFLVLSGLSMLRCAGSARSANKTDDQLARGTEARPARI